MQESIAIDGLHSSDKKITSTKISKSPFQVGDYSLTGFNSQLAVQSGLADANWYLSPVPAKEMSKLLQRRNWPGIRDTIIWLTLLIISAYIGYLWWGSWLAIFPFAVYGVLYASASDARWHETSHGTAFKLDFLNRAINEIACFTLMRESEVWRWSHIRHHSDTIIVGRDPEITAQRPFRLLRVVLIFLGIDSAITYFKKTACHSVGRILPDEKSFIPLTSYKKVFLMARIYWCVYVVIFSCAIYWQSWLPLMYFFLPCFYGAWLRAIYGLTQHAGLAENVLDHRLNSRTVYMNLINRFLYLNMNYHIEHHMFPLVPYYKLQKLHQAIKNDCPPPSHGIWNTWTKEIIPAFARQRKDTDYSIKRTLPPKAKAPVETIKTIVSTKAANKSGWVEIGSTAILEPEEALRFDHNKHSYAIYRTADRQYFATDGMCTHGNTHLAGGLVKGKLIECPRHNGRFDLRDGSPARPPVCIKLQTYKLEESQGRLWLNYRQANEEEKEETFKFSIVKTKNLTPFIKEITLKPDPSFTFRPGQFIQVHIPPYKQIKYSDLPVNQPCKKTWQKSGIESYWAENPAQIRRNYSLASNPEKDKLLKLNIRIATPPNKDTTAGAGSSYMWHCEAGDKINLSGPYGDFLIEDTTSEIIYLGGGSGMAPLRSHIAHLFENLHSKNKVSYWYGARSGQDLFYLDYFKKIASEFGNFSFTPVLSEPQPGDNWQSHTGLVHQALYEHHLSSHPSPQAIKYYLCGPRGMIASAREMLRRLGVPDTAIACDEFQGSSN